MTRQQEIKDIRRKHFTDKDWCKECHKYIPYNKPCEHFEAKRQENIKRTMEDTKDAELPYEPNPADIWSIAERLQYTYHVKKREE